MKQVRGKVKKKLCGKEFLSGERVPHAEHSLALMYTWNNLHWQKIMSEILKIVRDDQMEAWGEASTLGRFLVHVVIFADFPGMARVMT